MCEEEWMAHGPSHNSPKKVAFRIARTTLKGNSWPSRRPRGPKPDMVVVDRGWVREDGKLAIDSLNYLFIGSNLKSSQRKFHQHKTTSVGRFPCTVPVVDMPRKAARKVYWTETGRADSFTEEWPYGDGSTCSPAEVCSPCLLLLCVLTCEKYPFRIFEMGLARACVCVCVCVGGGRA